MFTSNKSSKSKVNGEASRNRTNNFKGGWTISEEKPIVKSSNTKNNWNAQLQKLKD